MNDRLRTALLLGVLVAVPAFARQDAPPPRRRIHVGSDPRDYSRDPAGDAARTKRFSDDLAVARAAFGRGDLREAKRSAEAALLVVPGNPTVTLLLADLAFLEGRVGEVDGLLARPGSDDGARLRLALAAGLQGRTPPGEEDYCRAQLTIHVSAPLLQGSLPNEGAPRSAPLLAALALGEEGQSNLEPAQVELYYGIALRLDPGNPFANFELGRLDASRGQDASARAHLRLASRRGGPYVREMVRRSLSDLDRTKAKTGTNPR